MPSRQAEKELARFSKVIGAQPTCRVLQYERFNASDQVTVSFEAPHSAPPRLDPNSANNNNNNNGGGGARHDDHWQAPGPLHDWSAYFVPYAILSLAVVALIAITLRSRRDRQSNKRMPV